MADSSSENLVKHNSINTLCFQLIFVKTRHTRVISLSLMIVTVFWKSCPWNAKYWVENCSEYIDFPWLKMQYRQLIFALRLNFTCFGSFLMPLFLYAGCRWIMSLRAGIRSDTLGHCQAEVTASESDLSWRTTSALIQSGSQVTCTGSGLLQALVLCGLRRTHDSFHQGHSWKP